MGVVPNPGSSYACPTVKTANRVLSLTHCEGHIVSSSPWSLSMLLVTSFCHSRYLQRHVALCFFLARVSPLDPLFARHFTYNHALNSIPPLHSLTQMPPPPLLPIPDHQ